MSEYKREFKTHLTVGAQLCLQLMRNHKIYGTAHLSRQTGYTERHIRRIKQELKENGELRDADIHVLRWRARP